MITKKIISRVKDWNREKRAQGKHILVYTLGDGSMADEPRKRGYVVQKYHKEAGERSRFHLFLKDAQQDYESDDF